VIEPASGWALEMRRVSKRFPGTIAVDDVSFEVRAGEVHALVGENGAGKSTLMKMLAGSFDDYTGDILIGGRTALLHSPTLAKRHGIGMIYQELSLARPISITENLLAGRLPRRGSSSRPTYFRRCLW
jgi:ABC-type sugar transport system ATPase subunit